MKLLAPNDISRNIKILVERNNLTIEEMSDILYLSERQISRYLNGKVKKLDIYLLEHIANYFEISIEELILKKID